MARRHAISCLLLLAGGYRDDRRRRAMTWRGFGSFHVSHYANTAAIAHDGWGHRFNGITRTAAISLGRRAAARFSRCRRYRGDARLLQSPMAPPISCQLMSGH